MGLEISWRDTSRSLTELIFDVVSKAVGDSGVDMTEIQDVVLAANDLVDGRSLTSMVTAPAAGAYLRDEIRFGDDSAAAFAYAVARIESGLSKACIVASWGRTSEHSPDAVARSLFDPLMSRPLGLREVDISAMRGVSWWRQHPDRLSDIEAARTATRKSAAANPRAVGEGGGWVPEAPGPLTAEDMPTYADIVAAAVLTAAPGGVRVRGVGQGSEPYFIGDRDLPAMSALRLAAERAFADAGLTAHDIDVAEIEGQTLVDEALSVEAVGLAQVGEGFDAIANLGHINPSGGRLAGYCGPAMGLTRIVEAVLQLRGEAGAVQCEAPATALATGSSMVGGQTQTAIILERA
ncbi:hypothetical protein [Nocardioides sp.]|uniref:thiolase C-terminal domain-containing protein n=1 Tax=Nocardioides sp. TaxID=35761 RepID=UPI0026374182|nr:hypothetical protein [Nocardioides sp.]